MASQKNAVVSIQGIVKGFTANRKAKEGDQKTLTGKILIEEPDEEIIAQLCPKPKDAVKAMKATRVAKSKLELPCRPEEMHIDYKVGERIKTQSNNATLKKIIFDCTNGKQVAEIQYGEPLIIDVAIFFLERLGAEANLDIQQMQKDLGLEDDGE